MINKQFIAGFALAGLVLAGAITFAAWGGITAPEPGDTNGNSEEVTRFTEAMRSKVVTEIGQPIEGFEPFMFMQVYPGLIAEDFHNVNALIGRYVAVDGEVTYDLQGEQELHSAARAISDEGMEQLFNNILARVSLMAGSDPVEGALQAISGASEPTVLEGTITCLPHKGDGPHTLECAFGLQTANGQHYGLRNLWDVNPDLNETQVRVRVTGEITPPEPNEKYDIVGIVEVESAERI